MVKETLRKRQNILLNNYTRHLVENLIPQVDLIRLAKYFIMILFPN